MLLYIINVLATFKLIETLALRNFTVIADAIMLESLSDLNCFSGGGLSQASVVFEECWFVWHVLCEEICLYESERRNHAKINTIFTQQICQ